MKLLVVTADDLGVDEDRNEGILEGVRAGVVTSVSILANGPAFEHAVELLKEEKRGRKEKRSEGLRPSLGLHLNLTQGRPLARGLRLLAGGDGSFRGRDGAFDLLGDEGAVDERLVDEVRTEAEAQYARLGSAGLCPDHLDGHHHVQVFPAVASVAAALARRHGMGWVRVPDEPLPPPWDPGAEPDALEQARRFSALAARARSILAGAARIAAFRGLTLKGRVGGAAALLAASVGEGVTELMTHPGNAAADPAGVAAAGFGFSGPERRRELDGLLDASFRAALSSSGVTLGRFPCGS